MIDALARRYAVAPHEVLEWGPFEVTLAIAAMEAGKAQEASMIRRTSTVFPVVVLGGH